MNDSLLKEAGKSPLIRQREEGKWMTCPKKERERNELK